MNPAFAYQGLQLRHGRTVDGKDVVTNVEIDAKDQFALELDHMSECVLTGRPPHTGGEEGLQDIRIIAAAYESAQSGSVVRLAAPRGHARAGAVGVVIRESRIPISLHQTAAGRYGF